MKRIKRNLIRQWLSSFVIRILLSDFYIADSITFSHFFNTVAVPAGLQGISKLFFFLSVNRPCIQVGVHDFEGFFYTPEIRIGIIDILVIHPGFGCYKEVIAGKFQVSVNDFFIDFYKRFFTGLVCEIYVDSSSNGIEAVPPPTIR